MTTRVLVVDDDAAVREALTQTLDLADLVPTAVGSFIEAKDHIVADFDGIVLSDIRMPGKDGFAVLDHAQKVDPDLPVILLTGEGDIPMAVKGISSGAFDFLEKPCPPEALLVSVRKALGMRSLVLENRRLKAEVERGDEATRMIFGSSQMAEDLRNRIRRVAAVPSEVLITGAPGTGTGKVAEVIHRMSHSARHPFRKCPAKLLTVDGLRAAMSETEGGSVFIDEVIELSPDVQFALLDLLDESDRPRILSGTYGDVETAVSEGKLNHDLRYKLDVVRVRVPALKERTEDIPVLFRHYLRIACDQADIPEPEVTAAMNNRLMEQDWPGNSRALMNTAMRFAMGLPESEADEDLGLVAQMARYERSLLAASLRQHKGNATETAAALKLPRKTFYDKLTRHDLKPESFR